MAGVSLNEVDYFFSRLFFSVSLEGKLEVKIRGTHQPKDIQITQKDICQNLSFNGFYLGKDQVNVLAVLSIEQDFIQKYFIEIVMTSPQVSQAQACALYKKHHTHFLDLYYYNCLSKHQLLAIYCFDWDILYVWCNKTVVIKNQLRLLQLEHILRCNPVEPCLTL